MSKYYVRQDMTKQAEGIGLEKREYCEWFYHVIEQSTGEIVATCAKRDNAKLIAQALNVETLPVDYKHPTASQMRAIGPIVEEAVKASLDKAKHQP